MSKSHVTRRQLLVSAAPVVASVPLVRLALPGSAGADVSASHAQHSDLAHAGHAAMIGEEVPAPGGPRDLDALLEPPAALPHQPGRPREYTLTATDREIEVAKGITFPAWTYNGTVPGPVIRATEDDLLRVRFVNAGSHPHTIHFHGIHPANMDGVFEVVGSGEELVYEFPARPYGMHLYHCHATPLKKHIHKGLYGAFIIDPPEPRKPARELVMVMNGYDTDGDGENNFYTVNGLAFYYAKYPIRVRRSETVRIYLANLTEFDLVNGRFWALVPVLLIVGAVSLFAATGGSLVGLIGQNPPQPDEFDVRRVVFEPGEIRVRVTNPQPDDLTIAAVTVDDAIVPFEVEGSSTLSRLRSTTIVVPFDWVEDDPIAVGITSSTGIQTVEEIPAAVETPGISGQSFLGYGLIGFLVGIVPVVLGLLWLPSLRRAAPDWLAAFMALTGGLLTFLAVEALSEALTLQAALPSALGGAGLVLLGVAGSFLLLTFISQRLAGSEVGRRQGAPLGGLALATVVAVGIGLHNLGEGLAIGSSFALGELALGSFLIVGFMVHNVTEGLGIAAPLAESRSVPWQRLALLALVAGAPAILGAWIGGFITNDVLGVIFFAAAAGAAFEVVVEVGRYLARKAPGGLTSGYVVGGFLAGIVVMYVTGLLI